MKVLTDYVQYGWMVGNTVTFVEKKPIFSLFGTEIVIRWVPIPHVLANGRALPLVRSLSPPPESSTPGDS